MTEERLIAGIKVTLGPDGQQLPNLIEKACANGIEVIGDMAYVSEDNLAVCGDKITLIDLEKGFYFNKDAVILQCPVSELAMWVEKRTATNGNTYLKYIFSKVKCRKCPFRENCRVGRSKSKERSYSITQVCEKNQSRLDFEASEGFQERLKIRIADSVGLFVMQLQMYFTAFVVKASYIMLDF